MNNSAFMVSAREEERLLRTRPLLRVVNYHNTPRVQAAQMERELQQYSQHFSSVNEAELRSYIQTGRWSKPKPGMIPVIYEGYRNGYDTMAPLLEQYGFVGWFFIITGFVNADRRDQVTYAKGHHIGMQTREYPQGRYALNWDEIRELSKRHVIGSHARNHADLSLLSEAERRSEILGSQQDFREHLGRPVLSFSSLRGPAQNDHPEVDTAALVRAAGYEFVFSSYRIQRVGNGVPTAL